MTQKWVLFILMNAVLIGIVICAADEECPEKCFNQHNLCYECSTQKNESYCGDPFDEKHNKARKIRCKSACAKWVRKQFSDSKKIDIIRTCATNLEMTIPVSMVCMSESRPGYGHLCFCKGDECNLATRAMAQPTILLPTFTVTMWILSQIRLNLHHICNYLLLPYFIMAMGWTLLTYFTHSSVDTG